MYNFIGIAGFKGSGKDTFANFFVDAGFTKINFADNLKKMCADAFEISEIPFFATIIEKEALFIEPIILNDLHIDSLNNWIAGTHPFKIPYSHVGKELRNIRDILQYVGTEMIRHAYPDYHVEFTLEYMKKFDKVVCSDIRFVNELEGMRKVAKENGTFKSFYVLRPGYEGDNHASEISIKPEMVDIVVVNDKTIADLHKYAEPYL